MPQLLGSASAARQVRQRTRQAFADLDGQGLVPTWTPRGYLFTAAGSSA